MSTVMTNFIWSELQTKIMEELARQPPGPLSPTLPGFWEDGSGIESVDVGIFTKWGPSQIFQHSFV